MIYAGVIASALLLPACASSERWPGPPPHSGHFVLTGRIVAVRTVTEVIPGGVDVTLIDVPAFTLAQEGGAGAQVEFVNGQAQGCPADVVKGARYRVSLYGEPRAFATMSGDTRPDFPDLVARECVRVGEH